MREQKLRKLLPGERLLLEALQDDTATSKLEIHSTHGLDLMLPRQMAEVRKLRKKVQLNETKLSAGRKL